MSRRLATQAEQALGVTAQDLVLFFRAEPFDFAHPFNRGRPGGDRVGMIEITADDDAMILPLPRRVRQIGLVGDRRDIELVEVFARLAL